LLARPLNLFHHGGWSWGSVGGVRVFGQMRGGERERCCKGKEEKPYFPIFTRQRKKKIHNVVPK